MMSFRNKAISFYNEIRIPSVFSLLAVYCCYLSLTPLKSDFGWPVCLAVYIVTYIAAERINTNFAYFKTTIDHIWKKVLAVLLFIYFIFSICGIAFLEDNGMDGFAFDKRWYVPVMLVWIIPLFFEIIRFSNNIITIPLKKPLKDPPWFIKVLAVLILLVYYGLWLYAFNPCISCYDTAFLYDQAHKMREVPMMDWHPPFYAILQSYFIKIYDSVLFMVILQCILYSLMIVRILDYLLKKGLSYTYVALAYLFWGFGFNNVIQVLTLWKDAPYLVFIMWLTFLLVRYVSDGDSLSVNWYIEFALVLIFTALLRQNGIVPAIVTSMVMMIIFIKRKSYKALLSIILPFFIIIFIRGPVYSYYRIDNVPGLKYLALANDLVGTYYDISSPSEDLVDVVNDFTNNDPGAYKDQHDSYYLWLCNYFALRDYSIEDFISVYIHTWFQHPGTLTRNFLRRTSVLWSIVRPLEEMKCSVNNLDDYHLDDVQYDFPHRINNPLTEGLTDMSNTLTDNSLVYVFAWRSGIYILFLLFFMFHLAGNKDRLALIPYIPIVFNIFALYVGSGWTDYRYSWPTVIISILLYGYTRLQCADKSGLSADADQQ